MIAFYYALTGLSCPVYYRHELPQVGLERVGDRRRAAGRRAHARLALRRGHAHRLV